MKTRFAWVIAAAVVCIVPCFHGTAQNFGLSELVLTDTTAGAPGDAINDLELYDNGLYWTVPPRPGSPEFGHEGGLGLLAQRDTPRSTPYYVVKSGVPQSLGFATRDDTFIYYSAGDGIHRKPVDAAPDDAGTLIGPSLNIDQPGALMVYQGRIYYALGNSTPFVDASSSRVQFKIEYFPAPGTGALETPVRVAIGSTLPGNPGAVTKLGVAFRQESGVSGLVPFGIGLTANGFLLAFNMEAPPAFFLEARVLATDVADFVIRHEQFTSPGGLQLPFEQDSLYAIVGKTVCKGGSPGTIKRIDPLNGNVTTFWTAPDGVRLTAIGADQDYFFVSSFPVTASQQLGCSTYTDGSILSKYQPASIRPFVGTPPTDPNWGQIVLVAGSNLRSDGQSLYFTYQQQIRRMPNNSPRIVFDLAAVGLEAVQAVQDFNNSVPLVEGRPALVRGYAMVAQNSAYLGYFRVTAALHARQNGAELPGSPLLAENEPLIDEKGNLNDVRADLNRSFQFHVPASWLVPGTLTLTLNVNPNLSVPENVDMLANNTVSADITVVPARRPTLVFKPMSSTFPNYDPLAAGSGFADIINRALTLLPVNDFKIFFANGSVTKPVASITGVHGRSFDMPGDKDWALIFMTLDHLFSNSPDGNPDTHWVGMFPPQVRSWNGIGGAVGVKISDLMDNPPVDLSIPDTAYDNTVVVRMTTETAASHWGTIRGGHTLAHELGHNYGRFHIRQEPWCGSQDPARPWHAYPADPCTLGKVDLQDHSAPIGYDPISGSLVLPGAAGDLMSYADSDWISPFTWNALVSAIPAPKPLILQAKQPRRTVALAEINPQPLPPHDPIFIWDGIINADGQNGLLLNGFRLPRGALDARMVMSSLNASASMPPQAAFHLRLLGNPNAAPLDDRPVTLMGHGDGDASTMAFVQAMPDLGGATRVQLMNGGVVLSEIVASPNVPTLVLGQPVIDHDAQTLSLTWTAADADGDPLLFSVQFSSDGGKTWQSLLVNQPESQLAISTRLLPGSANAVLRVIASDGFNTALALTGPFVIPAHAPEMMISGIVDGQRIAFGNPVTVSALAYDAEEGSLPASSVRWTIAGPTQLSMAGGGVSLAGFAPGEYSLTAQATDSDGNLGTTTLEFEILPLVVPDTVAPTVDGLGTDPGYADAQVVSFSPPAIQPGARLIHANGMLFASIVGLPQSAAGTPEATLTMAIDPTQAGNSTAQAGDVALSVTENGLPHQFRGDGTSLVAEPLTFGVHAVIHRQVGFWNAELAIPDGALGGWNHGARVALQVQWSSSENPTQMLVWPSAANLASPVTWAPAFFGANPPPSSNRPPVALATGPAVVPVDDSATVGLSGAGSFDPDGDSLTFSWSQTDGPSVLLQGADSAAPSFTFSKPDAPIALTFQLTVNDGQVDSPPARVTVQLVPQSAPPPVTGDTVVKIDSANGSAAIQLPTPGPAGSSAVIQASTNLMDWSSIGTNVVGTLQTIAAQDSAAGQFPERFYRATPWNQSQVSLAGSALQFNGADGLVTVLTAPDLNSLPLSITAWINTTQSAGAYPAIISKYEGGRAHGYALALDSGRFTPWYYVDGNNHVEELTKTQLDGRFVADGRWHHLAYVVGMTNAQIYIDGTLMNDLPWVGTASPVTTSAPLLFGLYSGGSGQYYAGQLDEVSIWNRALNETEIRSQVHHLLPGPVSGLVGYWRFDEASGATVSDSSSQGHDGTMSGGVSRTDSTSPLYP